MVNGNHSSLEVFAACWYFHLYPYLINIFACQTYIQTEKTSLCGLLSSFSSVFQFKRPTDQPSLDVLNTSSHNLRVDYSNKKVTSISRHPRTYKRLSTFNIVNHERHHTKEHIGSGRVVASQPVPHMPAESLLQRWVQESLPIGLGHLLRKFQRSRMLSHEANWRQALPGHCTSNYSVLRPQRLQNHTSRSPQHVRDREGSEGPAHTYQVCTREQQLPSVSAPVLRPINLQWGFPTIISQDYR